MQKMQNMQIYKLGISGKDANYAKFANQTYQSKATKLDLTNQTYQPNLHNQTKLSQPSLLNQTYQTKPTKPNENY